MLVVYLPRGNSLERVEVPAGGSVPTEAIWFDLLSPTAEEDRAVEAVLGVSIPSREEMAEIEPSSRLYVENGARFMTMTLLYNADTDRPNTTPVTCILSNGKLVTVRYEEPRPFARLSNKLTRTCPPTITGEGVLIDLLDGVIDRAADVLERDSAEIEIVSRRIFGHGRGRKGPSDTYQEILRAIGRKADLTSKVRESLVSIGRIRSVPGQRVRRAEVAKGTARTDQEHGARRDFAHRPCHVPRQQDPVHARRGARAGAARTEQRDQDFLGGGRGADAADHDRLDLRHELRAHAGARNGPSAIRWRSC